MHYGIMYTKYRLRIDNKISLCNRKDCYQELSFYWAYLLRNIDAVLFFMQSREFGLVGTYIEFTVMQVSPISVFLYLWEENVILGATNNNNISYMPHVHQVQNHSLPTKSHSGQSIIL